jgi:fibronectin-binding autotransporter adhesin
MDAGTGAASVSSPTLYIDDAESWNNNSSASLTVGGALEAAYSSSVLTFAGQGNGSVNITGTLSSGIGIDQESATSTLYLSNASNAGLVSLTINGGTVVAAYAGPNPVFNFTNAGSIFASLPVTIKNGGTLTLQTSASYENPTTITGGGTLNFAGDSFLNWGNQSGTNNDYHNNNTNTITADVLTLGTGDDLDTTVGSQHITTLDLAGSGGNLSTGSRLIVGLEGQGLGFLGGISTINVGAGYILDFGSSGTVAGTVDFANGSALEARSSSAGLTNVSLDSVVLPMGGTVTVGNDDTGASNTIHLLGDQVLSGTVTFNEVGAPNTIYLDGNFSGSSGLTFTANNTFYGFGSAVVLTGTNTYSGPTILSAAGGQNPIVEINGDSTGLGSSIQILDGLLELGPNALLSPSTVITIGDPNSRQNSQGDVAVRLGTDSTAVNFTVYNNQIQAVSNWNNPNDIRADTIIGSAAGVSVLTWQVDNGVTATYTGELGNSDFGGGNNLELVKTGTGTLVLTGTASSLTGGVQVDNGTLGVGGVGGLDLNNGPTGPSPITLNNGVSVLEIIRGGMSMDVVTGTAGTVTFGSDTISIAGQIAVNGDQWIYGSISGGNGVAFIGGDALINESSVGTPGAVYVENGARVLMFYNTYLIDGATSVVTADGGILDFGNGDSSNTTENTPIYFSDGGALEDRNTDEILSNVQPLVGTSGAMPTLTIGSDDNGGGSITITNSVHLNSNIEVIGVQSDGRNFTFSNFAGGFSGTGNLNFDTAALVNGYITTDRGLVFVSGSNTYKGDTIIKGGVLDLIGSSAGVTSASGGAPNYYVSSSDKTYTDGNGNVQTLKTAGVLQVGAGGSLANNANIILGGATAGSQGYLSIGDLFGATDLTVGSITANAGGGAIINSDYANTTMETLTVNVAANTTDTYTGAIGSDPYGYNFGYTAEGTSMLNNANQLSLVKSGAGTLALNGLNNYAGTTTVNGGKLNINSVLNSDVTVNAGGAIGGSGFIKGTIRGAGAVTLGDPTVLVANAVDPSSGMSFNFEFTLTGEPNYVSAGSSGNDVLHLESGSPFAAAFTAANVFNIYLAGNGTFDGGIFVNGGDALTANNIAGATYNYYVLNNIGGDVTYDGNRYSLASEIGGTVTESTFQALGAGFDDGTTDGYEQQFVVSGAVIPEPSTYALMGMAGLMFLAVRRRLKA